jgi:hypothetical protein
VRLHRTILTIVIVVIVQLGFSQTTTNMYYTLPADMYSDYITFPQSNTCAFQVPIYLKTEFRDTSYEMVKDWIRKMKKYGYEWTGQNFEYLFYFRKVSK